MATPLEELIAGLELQLLRDVERLAAAQIDRRYVQVLEIEERIERLHAALEVFAERLAAEGGRGSSPGG